MELTRATIKTYGADLIAKATGLSRRTVYRWAAEGVPGAGTIGAVRKAAIAQGLQKIVSPKGGKKRRAA